MIERRVRVVRLGRHQAVPIPRELELSYAEAIMRKDGTKLIIRSAAPKSLLSVLARLKPLQDDFPALEDRRPRPIKR